MNRKIIAINNVKNITIVMVLFTGHEQSRVTCYNSCSMLQEVLEPRTFSRPRTSSMTLNPNNTSPKHKHLASEFRQNPTQNSPIYSDLATTAFFSRSTSQFDNHTNRQYGSSSQQRKGYLSLRYPILAHSPSMAQDDA